MEQQVKAQPPSRYRLVVIEESGPRPLAGMRLATSLEEVETMLFHLRAMNPIDRFAYEAN